MADLPTHFREIDRLGNAIYYNRSAPEHKLSRPKAAGLQPDNWIRPYCRKQDCHVTGMRWHRWPDFQPNRCERITVYIAPKLCQQGTSWRNFSEVGRVALVDSKRREGLKRNDDSIPAIFR